MGERGISEHAVWNQPIMCGPISSRQIITDDPKIVFGYVRELWAAGALSHGPDVWRTRFQPTIDANVTAAVQLNAGLSKSNSGRVRNAPNRRQNIAAIDVLLTRRGPHCKRNLISRSPAYLEQFGLDENLNTLVAENAPHLLRDVNILASEELRSGLDDGHIAAKASISLCQF
jgi:hypothetical protein